MARNINKGTGRTGKFLGVIISLVLGIGLLAAPSGAAEAERASGHQSSPTEDRAPTRGERVPMCQILRSEARFPCGNSMAVGRSAAAARTYTGAGVASSRYGVAANWTEITRKVLTVRKVAVAAAATTQVKTLCRTKKCKRRKKNKKYVIYQMWANHYQTGTKYGYKIGVAKKSKFGKRFLRKQERACRSRLGHNYSCHARAYRLKVKGRFPATVVQRSLIVKYVQKHERCPYISGRFCND